MATITVCGLNDETHARLRVRAARHGRSMEAEARAILDDTLIPHSPKRGFGSRVHARFAGLGDVVLEQPDRSERPRAAVFDEP